jgi:hypothetical protein
VCFRIFGGLLASLKPEERTNDCCNNRNKNNNNKGGKIYIKMPKINQNEVKNRQFFL